MANIKLRAFNEISTQTAVFKMDIRHISNDSYINVPVFLHSALHHFLSDNHDAMWVFLVVIKLIIKIDLEYHF